MKRMIGILALGLMAAPAAVSAQFEVGVDFFGLSYTKIDGLDDALITVDLPVSGMRFAFPAGAQMLIETRIEADWQKVGDSSDRSLTLVPGLNYLVNEQLYVRGEVGLQHFKSDDGTNPAISGSQYLFGGAVGTRRPMGMGIMRLEAGVVKALENQDDFLASWFAIHASAGFSVAVN
jgi:hypothetical protein